MPCKLVASRWLAICARQTAVVQAVADRLGIPLAATDWRQTLLTLKPEIVALTTPAALRGEVIEVATELGCHLLCEKPLATTAVEAKRLYALAEQAGVKHAYAATHRYDPSIAWLTQLLRDGAIGQLREIDVLARYQWITDLTPWFWWDSLATGGGALNAGLTHFLGMLEDMIGGKVQHVTGEARVLRRQAPIVPGLHDYRLRAKTTLTAAEAANLEWRACDADNAFSALLQFAPSRPDAPPVEVYMNVSAMAGRNAPTNGWYFYGNKGTLIGDGFVSLNVFRQKDATAEREPFPIPSHLPLHYRKWGMKSRTSGQPLAATLWPIFAVSHTRPILLFATAGAIRKLSTPSVRGVAGLRCPHNGDLTCKLAGKGIYATPCATCYTSTSWPLAAERKMPSTIFTLVSACSGVTISALASPLKWRTKFSTYFW